MYLVTLLALFLVMNGTTSLGRAMLLAVGRAIGDQRAAGKRVTDVDLAKVVGTSKNTIGRRLAGKGKLSADEFELFAKALGISVDDLWASARKIQRESEPSQEPAATLEEHVIRQTSPDAQAGIREGQAVIAERKAAKRAAQGPPNG